MNNNEEKQHDMKIADAAQAPLAPAHEPAGTQPGAPVSPAPQATEAAAKDSPELQKKPFVSWGKRIHNEITYRGVDWIFNSAVGVAFTYWSTRTNMGKKAFGEPVFNGFKKLLNNFYTDKGALEKGAQWGSNFVNIMVGGFTTIPPMMALENKDTKKKIIRGIDEVVYGKDTVKNDPKFEESYKEIDKEPKKDFWSGFWARWIAIAPLITAVSSEKVGIFLEEQLYDRIARGTKSVSSWLKIKPGKMALEGDMVPKKNGKPGEKVWQSNWDYFHQIVGFDFGLTVFYSALHEMAYKFLARKKDDHKKEDKAEHLQEIEDVASRVIAKQQATERSDDVETKRFTEQTRQGQGVGDVLERGGSRLNGYAQGILQQQEQQSGLVLGA
jgi:hypothetical protein